MPNEESEAVCLIVYVKCYDIREMAQNNFFQHSIRKFYHEK